MICKLMVKEVVREERREGPGVSAAVKSLIGTIFALLRSTMRWLRGSGCVFEVYNCSSFTNPPRASWSSFVLKNSQVSFSPNAVGNCHHSSSLDPSNLSGNKPASSGKSAQLMLETQRSVIMPNPRKHASPELSSKYTREEQMLYRFSSFTTKNAFASQTKALLTEVVCSSYFAFCHKPSNVAMSGKRELIPNNRTPWNTSAFATKTVISCRDPVPSREPP